MTLFERVLFYFYKSLLQYIHALALKYSRLVTFDDYGSSKTDDWNKELETFIKNIILPPLSLKDITAIPNAGFTKSARQAAHACGIILLNDNQLDDLLEYVKPERE